MLKTDWFQQMARPMRRRSIQEVDLRDDLTLLAASGDQAITLNASARAIWELCDGQHTIDDMFRKLSHRYACVDVDLLADLTATLDRLQSLNVLELSSDEITNRPCVKFVVGIEDTPYFHWQLPILCESFCRQLPPGWEILVVVCNDHEPLSETLQHIVQTYPVRYLTGADHPSNENMDFAGGGDRYVPINRIEALNIIADHLNEDDMVCLMETDIFLYRELNPSLFPQQNALCSNWLIAQDRFFTERIPSQKGIHLPTLLASLGCSHAFKPGGVLVFLTGRTVKNQKFIQDCHRFTQVLYLLGKIVEVPKTWIAEMPCFALALTANGIDYDLIDIPEFVPHHPWEQSIPPGSLYHYYHDLKDGGDGAFHGSQWYKQLFHRIDFLNTDITGFSDAAQTEHERYFFALAKQAQQRLGYVAAVDRP